MSAVGMPESIKFASARRTIALGTARTAASVPLASLAISRGSTASARTRSRFGNFDPAACRTSASATRSVVFLPARFRAMT